MYKLSIKCRLASGELLTDYGTFDHHMLQSNKLLYAELAEYGFKDPYSEWNVVVAPRGGLPDWGLEVTPGDQGLKLDLAAGGGLEVTPGDQGLKLDLAAGEPGFLGLLINLVRLDTLYLVG